MTDTLLDTPDEEPAQRRPAEDSGSLGLDIGAAVSADDDAGPYVEAMDQGANPATTAAASLISELTHRHLEEVVIPRRDNADEESPSTAHRSTGASSKRI